MTEELLKGYTTDVMTVIGSERVGRLTNPQRTGEGSDSLCERQGAVLQLVLCGLRSQILYAAAQPNPSPQDLLAALTSYVIMIHVMRGEQVLAHTMEHKLASMAEKCIIFGANAGSHPNRRLLSSGSRKRT